MKYGIVYGYWSKDWEGEYPATIQRAAACGFDILELFTPLLLTHPRWKLDEIKSAARDAGIELTFLAGISKETDISSEDASARKNGIDYLKRLLEVIHYMGGRCFSGINFTAWADFTPPIHKAARWKYSVQSMKELAKVAEAYGISYNLEVTNRFENILINTSKEAVDFVNEVGSANVNILLDTFHMNIEEDSLYEAIVHAGKKLGHFHVGENNRRNPGSGMVRWDQVAKGLKEIHYDRAITLEPLVLMGGTVANDAKIWRDMSDGADAAQMDQNAKDGLAFIKNLLKD